MVHKLQTSQFREAKERRARMEKERMRRLKEEEPERHAEIVRKQKAYSSIRDGRDHDLGSLIVLFDPFSSAKDLGSVIFSICLQGEGAAGDGHGGGTREAETNPGEGEDRLRAELQHQVRRAAAVPALPQDVRVQNAHEGKHTCKVVQKWQFRVMKLCKYAWQTGNMVTCKHGKIVLAFDSSEPRRSIFWSQK